MKIMYHYVYYSYEEWGRGYIGVRSCKCLSEEDTKYLGSFYDKSFKPTEKVILSAFETREDALKAEIALHDFYKVHKNPHFANKAMQTSTKFVSNGEGIRKCLELYPDFHSEAGKIGGRTTYEKNPDLYSENGRLGGAKVRDMKVGIHSPDFDRVSNGRKGSIPFPAGSEAAKLRGQNGLSAMAKFWKEHPEARREKGTYGTSVQVILPSGEVHVFPSISVAAETLGVPKTTMKRLASGKQVHKYKNYLVTKL